jgi:Skp family chaperone for outer membrane proteins
MNIDERLEKLTAAVDKVTADVQVLAQMSASHESNLNQLFELHAAAEKRLTQNEQTQARNEQMQARNQELMAQVMEAINQLGRVGLSHEKRISDLEGGQA